MARKTSQIIRRGPQMWMVRIYLGRDPETRKRKYVGESIHGGLRELSFNSSHNSASACVMPEGLPRVPMWCLSIARHPKDRSSGTPHEAISSASTFIAAVSCMSGLHRHYQMNLPSSPRASPCLTPEGMAGPNVGKALKWIFHIQHVAELENRGPEAAEGRQHSALDFRLVPELVKERR